MTELKVTFNQCPLDDDKFVLKIEMRGTAFEATNSEEASRAFIGKCVRHALQTWCDKMVEQGIATHSVHIDIDGDEDEPENPFTHNKRY